MQLLSQLVVSGTAPTPELDAVGETGQTSVLRLLEIWNRIHRLGSDPHLEVQLGLIDITRLSGLGDGLPALHPVAALHQDLVVCA